MVKEKDEIKLYKIGVIDIINQKGKSEAKELFKKYIKNEILEDLKKHYSVLNISFQWRDNGFNDPITVYDIYSSIEYKKYLFPFFIFYDVVFEKDRQTKIYDDYRLIKTIETEKIY